MHTAAINSVILVKGLQHCYLPFILNSFMANNFSKLLTLKCDHVVGYYRDLFTHVHAVSDVHAVSGAHYKTNKCRCLELGHTPLICETEPS